MTPLEFLYYIGYSLDKRYKLKTQKRLPHKVISIGNITAGGTGKTPATIAIAEEAKRRGFNPVILTRGYKGKAKGPCFVQDAGYRMQDTGLKTEASCIVHHASCILYGDEPILMAERLKDVPIVKCADRYKGGMFAIEQLSAISYQLSAKTLFILDDGFQRWKLFRDKNILLIDAENPFDNRKLLPIGLLREPLREMKRADIIVLTKADSIEKSMIDSLTEEIRRYNKNAPIFLSSHSLRGFRKSSGEEMPIESIKDRKIFGFCGIGNPDSFWKTLVSAGLGIKGMKPYRDHHAYKQGDIEDITVEAEKVDADYIITTEKDMVRLKDLKLPENLICLLIDFKVDSAFYEETFG